MYIGGTCFTNLDDYKQYKWPHVFVAVPRKGEWVESRCGERILKVYKVTHKQCKKSGQPGILVELNKI